MNLEDKKLVFILIGLPAMAVALFIGLYIGEHSASPSLDISSVTDGSYVTSDQFAPFWKAWQVLNDKYVAAASTSVQDRVYG
ncbi:MAG: hypothetical protein KGI66_02980, partial [Patescibacteria group bacterium]|nr:hypothetical protein [Patescibacteria group bacterium]